MVMADIMINFMIFMVQNIKIKLMIINVENNFIKFIKVKSNLLNNQLKIDYINFDF